MYVVNHEYLLEVVPFVQITVSKHVMEPVVAGECQSFVGSTNNNSTRANDDSSQCEVYTDTNRTQ